MEKRICNYRNCGCVIPETTRSDARYCNGRCRDKERTYIKRERRRYENEQETIKSILNIIVGKSEEELNLLNKLIKN